MNFGKRDRSGGAQVPRCGLVPLEQIRGVGGMGVSSRRTALALALCQLLLPEHFTSPPRRRFARRRHLGALADRNNCPPRRGS